MLHYHLVNVSYELFHVALQKMYFLFLSKITTGLVAKIMVKSIVKKAVAFFSFCILNKTKNAVGSFKAQPCFILPFFDPFYVKCGKKEAANYKTPPLVTKHGCVFHCLFHHVLYKRQHFLQISHRKNILFKNLKEYAIVIIHS